MLKGLGHQVDGTLTHLRLDSSQVPRRHVKEVTRER